MKAWELKTQPQTVIEEWKRKTTRAAAGAIVENNGEFKKELDRRMRIAN